MCVDEPPAKQGDRGFCDILLEILQSPPSFDERL